MYTLKSLSQGKAISLIVAALVFVLGVIAIGIGTVHAAQVTIDFAGFTPPNTISNFNSGDEDGFHLAAQPTAKVINIFGDTYLRAVETGETTLTLTELDNSIFAFQTVDLLYNDSQSTPGKVTARGYLGSDLVATDEWVVPVFPNSFKKYHAVNLADRVMDRLVFTLIADEQTPKDTYIDNIVLETDPPLAGEMTVHGNGQEIANGDTTPSVADFTEFGSAISGSGSVTHTFSIANEGNADLELTGSPLIAISGAAAGDFVVTVNPSSPVAPSTETTFEITFSPSSEGLRHATVSIASNDSSDDPYTFAIQGTGSPVPQPHMIVSGNNHTITNGDTSPATADFTDFGSAVSGSGSVMRSFEIDNSGTADLNLTGTPIVAVTGAAAGDFTVLVDPVSTIAPNQQTTFTINFAPSAEGLRHATVSIANSDNANDPYTFAIQGTGAPAPKPHIVVSGNHHTIANGDTSPATADFTDFGSAVSGSGSVKRGFEIDNSGTADLNLTGTPIVTITGAAASDFTVNVEPVSTIGPNQTTAFSIYFSPSAEGLRHATVSIANNDSANDPYTFAIQGTGTEAPVPHMWVKGNGLGIPNGSTTTSGIFHTDFGSVVNGQTREYSFEIQNAGTADLNLTGTPKVSISGAAPGDFTVTVEPASTVGSHHNTIFKIRFAPSAVGLRTATVSIANNDSAKDPYTFAIQGTGTEAPAPHMWVKGNGLGIPNGSTATSALFHTDFGSVVSGQTREYSFEIQNAGTADLNLTGTPKVDISGAAGGDFTVTVEPASTVGSHHNTIFKISFAPSADGLRHATVSITNSDSSNDPYTFAIQGTGTVAPKPHIIVSGNSHTIANGDATPGPSDNTDFGSTVSGSGSVEHTFQIENSGTADLDMTGTPKVGISGAAAGDFTVTVEPASTIGPNHNTAFTIRFAPSAEGLRHATVSIANSDSSRNPYTFAIQGMGTAAPEPHIVVSGNNHTIANGDKNPAASDNTDFGSAISGSGNVEHKFQIDNKGTADLDLTGTPKVSISGAAAGDFTVTTQPAATVAQNHNTVFTIHFAPSAEGLRHATVSIANSDSSRNPYTFAIQGMGTAAPEPHIVVSGNSHTIANGDKNPAASDNTDFGSAISGSGSGSGSGSVEHKFQIDNKGTADLDLTGTPKVSISGAAAGDFTVTAEPASTVAAGHSTLFTIRFAPSSEGLRHATVSITNSDSSRNPYTFAIQGKGSAAPIPHIIVSGNNHTIANGDTTPSPADNTDFGSAVSGSGAVEHIFQIENGGTADLDLTGTPKVAISGAAAGDFTVTVEPASTISPNHSTVFTIHFAPSAIGLREAVVSISNSDPNQDPYTFAIQGHGTAAPQPHIQVLGDNHLIADGDTTPNPADNTDFGSVVNGSARELSFTVRNRGSVDLNLTGTPKVAISGAAAGDFSVTVEPASTLAPKHQSVFTIRFSPSAVGLREATVSISSDDTAQSPYTFAIQGHGTVAPAPHINLLGFGHRITNGSTTASVVDGTDFGSVLAGEMNEHVFSVRNSGSADLELTGTPYVSISGPGAAQFTITAQPGSPIGAQSESHFTIAFTPAAGGQSATATVTVTSNDAGRSPYTFVIEGHGGLHSYYFPVMPINQ